MAAQDTTPAGLGIASTPFVQIAGTLIALPAYARTDLAYTETIMQDDPGAGQSFVYMINGNFVEIVLNVRFAFTTSGAVASRTVELLLVDGSGNVLIQSSAPSTQSQGAQVVYNFNVGTPFALFASPNLYTTGMGVVALPASSSVKLTAINGQGGDAFTQVTLVTMRVPTGPALTLAPLLATPLVA